MKTVFAAALLAAATAFANTPAPASAPAAEAQQHPAVIEAYLGQPV